MYRGQHKIEKSTRLGAVKILCARGYVMDEGTTTTTTTRTTTTTTTTTTRRSCQVQSHLNKFMPRKVWMMEGPTTWQFGGSSQPKWAKKNIQVQHHKSTVSHSVSHSQMAPSRASCSQATCNFIQVLLLQKGEKSFLYISSIISAKKYDHNSWDIRGTRISLTSVSRL